MQKHLYILWLQVDLRQTCGISAMQRLNEWPRPSWGCVADADVLISNTPMTGEITRYVRLWFNNPSAAYHSVAELQMFGGLPPIITISKYCILTTCRPAQ